MSALNVILAELASSRRPDTDGIEISIGMLKHIAAQHAAEVEQARREGAEAMHEIARKAVLSVHKVGTDRTRKRKILACGLTQDAIYDAVCALKPEAAIRARGGSDG